MTKRGTRRGDQGPRAGGLVRAGNPVPSRLASNASGRSPRHEPGGQSSPRVFTQSSVCRYRGGHEPPPLRFGTRVARGVEPRVGPLAQMTNVIMTNEGIVTVGSFLFRFCGLIARSFTRTLLLGPTFWESSSYSEEAERLYLKAAPKQVVYWVKIFISFAVTGTHSPVPYRPANRNELIFEQVSRAMEIFAIAHEYGHHHLGHGRQLCDDPKLEEFSADQFALRICYEVEQRPLMFANPYLSSGAGGVVLLKALETLRRVRDLINPTPAKSSDTHPDIAARLARFIWSLC